VAISVVASQYFGCRGSFLAATGKQIIGIIPSAICLSRAGSPRVGEQRKSLKSFLIPSHCSSNLTCLPRVLAILSKEAFNLKNSRCEHKRSVMILVSSSFAYDCSKERKIEKEGGTAKVFADQLVRELPRLTKAHNSWHPQRSDGYWVSVLLSDIKASLFIGERQDQRWHSWGDILLDQVKLHSYYLYNHLQKSN